MLALVLYIDMAIMNNRTIKTVGGKVPGKTFGTEIDSVRYRQNKYCRKFPRFFLCVVVDLYILGAENIQGRRKLYPADDIAFLFADLINFGFDLLPGIAVVFQQFRTSFAETCIIRFAFVMSTGTE